MKGSISLLAVLAAVSIGSAQTYNISGVVTDTGTTPIAGASVRLEKAGLTATTGQDGRFTLTGTAGIARTGGLASNRPAVTLQGGSLRFDLPKAAIVRVQVYSVQGRLLSTVQRSLGAGKQSLAMPQYGSGVYLYAVRMGSQEFLLKGNSVGGNTLDVGRVTLDVKPHLGTGKLAAVAINDVIGVTKSGFLNYRVVVYTTGSMKYFTLLRHI